MFEPISPGLVVGSFAVGKTTFVKEFPELAIDLELKNYASPTALIEAATSSKHRYVFLSSKPEIIEGLDAKEIKYTLCVPFEKDKDKWIERVRTRDGNDEQATILDQAWDSLMSLTKSPPPWRQIRQITVDQYLSDLLDRNLEVKEQPDVEVTTSAIEKLYSST